jgi:ATP-dependent RNA circularization protein (DNA/RNA ligase family)
MEEYHKIQSIFKRDEATHKFIEGQWSLPEFEYLRDNLWEATEKIDGTNIRVAWDNVLQTITFGGRTDNAQIPAFLITKLQQLFPQTKFADLYHDISMVLYGEGYGARIQKGGGNYIPNGCDFALFDVLIGGWWLSRENIEDIARKLEIKCVPLLSTTITLPQAIERVKHGLVSFYGNFEAEGMVLKPCVELKNRKGYRVITKLKHKDF